jgi:hypothetical protein
VRLLGQKLLVASTTTAAAGRRRARAPASRARRPRHRGGRDAARRQPPGEGTRLEATIALAPWRTGARAVPRVRARRRRRAWATACSRWSSTGARR